MISNITGSDFKSLGLQLPKLGRITLLLALSATLNCWRHNQSSKF